MIVQYIIDWEYIHREVAKATSEGLELINLRLRGIKKAVEKNGVLFLDANRLSIKNLNEIINDLSQDTAEDTIPEWQKITDTLKAFQCLYDDFGILLPKTNNSLAELLSHRDDFLGISHLARYDLPYALITDDSYEGAAQGVKLEDYLDSEIEKQREEWSNISFGEDDECAASKFWAGLSIGACASHEVTLYDPYFGGMLSNPEKGFTSFEEIMGIVVQNKYINSIRIVFRKEIVGEEWCFCRFKSNIQRLINSRRDTEIVFRFRAKPSYDRDFHDRWIDVGTHKCQLTHGMNVYRCQNNKMGRQRRLIYTFSAIAQNDMSRHETAERKVECHAFNDLKCHAQIGDVDKQLLLQPADVNDTVVIKIAPPIVIHIQGGMPNEE